MCAAVVLGIGACTTPPEPSPTPPSVGPSPDPEDAWRPAFHYAPPTGRLADPNGLVWYDDEWHLFHQADGTWAHAVSADLVHWQTLPTALEHDELGLAMSGSAVVDGANTSGLLPGGGLAALYTSTAGGEAQSLATSSDRGRTWTRYDGNPVIPNDGRADFRDPKVFWHAPTRRWVMVVSVGDAVELFASTDLRHWSFLSRFGDGQGLHTAVWECPDLFPLPVDGGDDVAWVLTVSVGDSPETSGSTAQYFVGDFDGTTFTRRGPADLVQVTDVGQDFYAAQTWENAPDGRRLWLGWAGNWRAPYSAPTVGWQGQMSVPRELALRTVDGLPRLVQTPAAELETLWGSPTTWRPRSVDGTWAVDWRGTAYELDAELDVGTAREVAVHVRTGDGARGGVAIGVTSGDDPQLFVDRSGAGSPVIGARDGSGPALVPRRTTGYRPVDGVVHLRVLVDASTVEAFVDDGALVATSLVYPPEGANGIAVSAVGGAATVRSLTVRPLRSP
ncbi:glycoside hydrolase family 32 protein [Cellulomonas massiliensis]|uniref:glycoside hydrolase family 32 protein n=1 Tax=Cellulomonas massiliensis TaxID=1465811 RepID=UPI0002DC5C4E|nr:glycoside hydrolase family 32 protein [Cellulomonas massiliensis]